MKRTTRIICAAAAAGFLCLAVTGTSRANSGGAGDSYVTLRYTGDDLARLGYVSYGGRTFLAAVGQSDFYVYHGRNTYAGLGADIVNASPDHTTTGYCIEVLKSIDRGSSYRFGVEDLSLAPTLFGNPDRATDLEKLFSLYSGSVVDDDTAAAFGAAIWEIVNETKTKADGTPVYDVRTGFFKVRPVVGRHQNWDVTADIWLASLASYSDTAPAYALVSARTQDFAWILPGYEVAASDSPPIPEPLTMISGLLAAGAVGSYVRKRARTQAKA